MVVASLVLALLGLAVIFIFTKSMQATEIDIGDLGDHSGEYVEVSGYVSKTRVSNENVFITVCRGECASVVIFRSIAKGMSQPNPYLVEKGDWLVVRGRVDDYMGEPEIVVLREGDIEKG